jgi:hypothetical protein
MTEQPMSNPTKEKIYNTHTDRQQTLEQGQAEEDEGHGVRKGLGQRPVVGLSRGAVPQEQVLADADAVAPKARQAELLLLRQLGEKLLDAV